MQAVQQHRPIKSGHYLTACALDTSVSHC